LGQIQYNTLEYLSIFASIVVAECYSYDSNRFKDWSFSRIIFFNGMELSTGKILEENLVQSAFHQTLGE
jgi:hypothetical protein